MRPTHSPFGYPLAGLGAALVGLLAGCQRPPAPAPSGAEEASAPTVTVVKPQKKAVRRLIEQPGYNVEAFRRAPLYAKVAGYVDALNVDIGDRVKAGDVLVELSVPELGDGLRRKEAGVKQAEAEVLQAKAALAAAAAALKSAGAMVKEAEAAQGRAKASYTRAKVQADRLADAGRRGVIDKEAVAEARHGLETAEAALKE